MTKFLLSIILLASSLANGAGIPVKEPSADAFIFGVSSSTDSKYIEFDTGDGAANVSMTIDDSRNVVINSNQVTIGDGSAGDKRFIMDIGGSNPEIRWNNASSKIQFSNDGSTYKNLGTGGGGAGGTNTLLDDNPDFEAGSPPGSWTASGGTFISETTSPLFGDQSGSWDSNGSAQTLSSVAKTITDYDGLIGNECVGLVKYAYPTGSSGDYALQVYDGSNVLAPVDLEVTSTGSREAFVRFTCPSTGTIQLRVISQVADADILLLDDAFLGSDIKSVQVASAEIAVDAQYEEAASCTWSRTNTATDVYGVDTDCTGIVVNKASSAVTVDTTDDDLPTLVLSKITPGSYLLLASFSGFTQSSGDQSTQALFRDGTLVDAKRTRASGGSEQNPYSLQHSFDVTSTTSTTFSIGCAATTGSCQIDLRPLTGSDEHRLSYTLIRYPLESEKAVTLESQGGSWSGYHDDTCAWSRTNTAFGDLTDDASCALVQTSNVGFGTVSDVGSVSPAIQFTPKSAGNYLVIADVKTESGTTSRVSARLTDGTNFFGDSTCRGSASRCTASLTGILNSASAGVPITLTVQGAATSGSIQIAAGSPERSAIEWTIIKIDQQFPQPIIPNAVVTPNTGTGMKYASVHIVEAGGTPTVQNQYGDAVDSIADPGTGLTTINWVSGYWSEVPICSTSIYGIIDQNTNAMVALELATTSSVQVQSVASTSAVLTDNFSFSVQCHGR